MQIAVRTNRCMIMQGRKRNKDNTRQVAPRIRNETRLKSLVLMQLCAGDLHLSFGGSALSHHILTAFFSFCASAISGYPQRARKLANGTKFLEDAEVRSDLTVQEPPCSVPGECSSGCDQTGGGWGRVTQKVREGENAGAESPSNFWNWCAKLVSDAT